MFRIAICDDERSELERTAALLKEYLQARPKLTADISLFAGGYALLDAAEDAEGFDLYILDVIMPDLNGIEVGKALRQMGRDGAIIYLTTSPDYAVESYQTQAFFYLLKPVQREQLFEILDKAMAAAKKRQTESIIVNTPRGLRSLLLEDILYVERVERFMRYYLAGGETVDSRTLRGSFQEAVADLLKDKRFILCGASFVLGLHHVKAVERGSALLDSGAAAVIPQLAFAEIKRAWMDYWLGGKAL